MCTVTFVKSSDQIIITSNRDETVKRPALEPRPYPVGQKLVYFPKDPRAGGTWFAVSDRGEVIVLLNGASEKHQWKPPYRKSRGLVVLDLMGAASPIESWSSQNLRGIEPFTIVCFASGALFQLRWDGAQKESVALDAMQIHIWSSTTLYPKEVRDRRQKWFDGFMEVRPSASPAEMFRFHRYTQESDPENGLVINRNGFLQTLSITQVVLQNPAVSLTHHDLSADKKSEIHFTVPAP